MSDTKMQDPGSQERFADDTAEHQLAVLHDDGLYRHLRFQKPGTGIGWFDLITWPGNLAIRGDCGTFTFARLDDMFEFFRGNRINPGYWAEKTPGGTRSCKEYSQEKLNRRVAEELAEAEPERPGITAAWAEKVSGEWPGWPEYDTTYEHEARRALDEFRYLPDGSTEKPFEFWSTCEWDLTDWRWEFLWCCYAIQWGIQQYDAARTAATSGSAA